MEFIIGFIIGLMLAQITSYLAYKHSLDEIQVEYTQKIMEIRERLSEYNRY